MNANQEPDGSLVVSYDSAPLAKVLAGLAALLVTTAIYDVTIGARGADRLVALLASAGVCGLSALVVLERSHFRFDSVRKRIDWTRRWGFRRRSGSATFHDVRSVVVEVPIGDSGTPSRRICLRLANGSPLPLTIGYRPDGDGKIAETAARVRAILGHDVDPPPTAEAQELVADGDGIAAIKLLVEQEGLSLSEAKQRVDAMKR